MIERYGDFYTLSCDACGETYMTFGETFDGAVRWGKQNGWKSQKYEGEWEDVCPECQEGDKQ